MQRVIDALERQMEPTRRVISEYPWEDALAYGMWLAQTYYMVNHSTRLVALAGAYVDIGDNSTHHRFVDHSVEERGHQNIAIADIKALGFKLSDFPKIYQSEAMYQIQYYWIQHRGAPSFFGYTLALETIAIKYGVEIYERARKAHGEKASNFIRVHSTEDVEHIATAYKHIERQKPEMMSIIEENLNISCELYRDMLLVGLQKVEQLRGKKAA